VAGVVVVVVVEFVVEFEFEVVGGVSMILCSKAYPGLRWPAFYCTQCTTVFYRPEQLRPLKLPGELRTARCPKYLVEDEVRVVQVERKQR